MPLRRPQPRVQRRGHNRYQDPRQEVVGLQAAVRDPGCVGSQRTGHPVEVLQEAAVEAHAAVEAEGGVRAFTLSFIQVRK